jgi:hypothetical protein
VRQSEVSQRFHALRASLPKRIDACLGCKLTEWTGHVCRVAETSACAFTLSTATINAINPVHLQPRLELIVHKDPLGCTRRARALHSPTRLMSSWRCLRSNMCRGTELGPPGHTGYSGAATPLRSCSTACTSCLPQFSSSCRSSTPLHTMPHSEPRYTTPPPAWCACSTSLSLVETRSSMHEEAVHSNSTQHHSAQRAACRCHKCLHGASSACMMELLMTL